MPVRIINKEASNKRGKSIKKTLKIPYAWIWLSVIAVVVYGSSLNHGLTELDDVIFIHEKIEYNKDASNLITSFERGVFAKKRYLLPTNAS